MCSSAGRRWNKERMRETGGRRQEAGNERGKDLTFGTWLSSQPWSSWVPPLSLLSQESGANDLNDRRKDGRRAAAGGVCYSSADGETNPFYFVIISRRETKEEIVGGRGGGAGLGGPENRQNECAGRPPCRELCQAVLPPFTTSCLAGA